MPNWITNEIFNNRTISKSQFLWKLLQNGPENPQTFVKQKVILDFTVIFVLSFTLSDAFQTLFAMKIQPYFLFLGHKKEAT